MDINPFDAGRKASATFFAQHGHTLCVFRDLSRAAHPSPDPLKACQEFDAGFARGLAEMIAGVRHG